MPNGSPGNGFEGGGGYTPPPGGTPSGSPLPIAVQGKIKERVKSLSYSATDNKLLLDVELATTEGSTKESDIGDIEIVNTGEHPAFAILAYRLWTAAATMSGTTYHVNYLLKPGQSMIVPDAPAVVADETIEQLTGTVVTNTAPSVTSNYAYLDSGATLGEDIGTDEVAIDVNDGDFFRVNDLIQVGINTTTITKIEIMRVTAISTNTLTVERELYGTTQSVSGSQTDATSGAVNGAKVYFPFFNIYHDHDRYTVVQTDSSGRFHAKNLFGAGRAATNLMGITPGSFSAKFYDAGYQNLGLSGITSSTKSGLTAGGSYWFKIAIDGGTAESINFTVDSSNTNWGGGTNGVISLINDALTDKYNNTASNTFQQKSAVGIVNGDIRFSSQQGLSTSAIALTAGTDGASASYNLFAQQNGHIPALANVPDAVAAKLPEDVVYDRLNYDALPNTSAFIYDDGYGHLTGSKGSGSLNYETGEIHMTGCPPNSEFVFSCLHTSPFSGRASATNTAKMNKLKAIYGNMPNQKAIGELTLIRR